MMVRVIGIDPGINNCGIALCSYDTDKDMLTVNDHFTLHANESAKKYNRKDSKLYGNIFSLFILEKEITEIFDRWSPDYVASEDAFYNPRTPNAFVSLKNCITSIRRVLYSKRQILYTIPPKLAKMTVVKATATKEDIITAVKKLPTVKIVKDTTDMVEHEADAIGIAHTFIEQFYKKNLIK